MDSGPRGIGLTLEIIILCECAYNDHGLDHLSLVTTEDCRRVRTSEKNLLEKDEDQ